MATVRREEPAAEQTGKPTAAPDTDPSIELSGALPAKYDAAGDAGRAAVQDSAPTIELSGELPTSPDEEWDLEQDAEQDSGPAVQPAAELPTEPDAAPAPQEAGAQIPGLDKPPLEQAVAALRQRWDKVPRWVVAAAAVAAVALIVLLLALPSKGLLIVSVAAPGDRAVADVQIFVDDEPRCEESPCRVADLSPGDHTVRVTARGYEPAEQLVETRAGFDLAVNVKLDWPSDTAQFGELGTSEDSAEEEEERNRLAEAQARARRSGKRRSAKALPKGTIKANSIPLSSVLVDGRPAGTTPARVRVAPGLHTVVFVHPEHGRRSVRVRVKPKREAVAAVRFRSGKR